MGRALVLSGGGVRGAFQAGAVHRLAESGTGGWQVVCGVSAGALNALLISQDLLDEMLRLWQEQARRGLTAFRSRLDAAALAVHAVAPGILTYADVQAMDGLFDNRELAEILDPFTAGLERRLEELGRQLRVGVVCLQTGEYVAADPVRDVRAEEITDLVMASTAIPLAFDPVELHLLRDGLACSGRRCQFVDGGTRNVTPLADAIHAAASSGIELEGIDVVLCSPLDPAGAAHEFHGLLEIGLRSEDILLNEIYRNDVELFRRANLLAAIRARLAAETGSGAALAGDVIQAMERHGIPIDSYRPLDLRILRPTLASWREFTGREDADLLGEYPETLDRNGEVVRLILGYGRWLAEHPEHHLTVPALPELP